MKKTSIDPIELAERLLRMRDWFRVQLGENFEMLEPGLRLRIDPTNESPFPSRNPNLADFGGATKKFDPKWLELVRKRFEKAGVKKFFFGLYPCAQEKDVEAALLKHGFKKFGGTSYPALACVPKKIPLPKTDLKVKRLIPGKDPAVKSAYDFSSDQFESTYGKPGFEHFAAFDGNEAVSTARLAILDGLAYLHFAGTSEKHRGRGGQSALIAARINRAAELGCDLAASETLGMLKTSLGNLKRQGLQVVYEKKMFQPK